MNMYPYNPLGIGQASYNPYLPQPNYLNYPTVTQSSVQPSGPHMEIQNVSGKDSAYAYPMGPNSSVILADSYKPKVWIVTTDASGFKVVKGFTITPDEEEEKTEIIQTKDDEIKELKDRIAKLEERMNGYGQSNTGLCDAVKPDSTVVRESIRNAEGIAGSNGSGQSNGGQ